MGNTNTSSRLNISTLTWIRFSHNLFDYQTNQYSRTNLRVDGQGFLIRKGFQIHYLPNYKEQDEVLLKVELAKNGKYIIDQLNKNRKQLDIMKVVKPEEEIRVNQNTEVKIGRVSLKIKKLEIGSFPEVRSIIQHCGKAGPGHECRFCFNQQNQITNPLLSPCSCNGSLKYIHLQCLKTWLKTRMSRQQEGGVVTFSWENLKCEICGGQIWSEIDLFSHQQADESTIVVQTTQQQQSQRKVNIFVIPIQKGKEKQISIGRGRGNDIRINDISVSRNHCRLIVREGKGYIQDNGSKFGTLIHMDKQATVQQEDEIWLQVGRTLIKVAKEQQY